MSVTIKEVARLSRCSVTTVSRALNGYSDVNKETRERICKVAAELNYQPNRIAQHLVTKKFNTIGLFSLSRSTFYHPFIAQFLSGLMDKATTHDYNVLLYGQQSIKSVDDLSQQCTQRGVGGAVIMGLRTDSPVLAELPNSSLPIVLVDIPVQGKRVTCISSDNQLGASQAVEHLISLGHQHIGFINGHQHAWVSQERLAGYKHALTKHNIPWRAQYVFFGDFSKESGKQGAHLLKEANKEITALFVASDLMASGAIEELHNMGYYIPKDISVVGFDDQDFSLHTRPTLTTVHQDIYGFGDKAAEQLIAMIDRPQFHPPHTKLNTSVVPRESSGPVKSY